MTSNRYFPNPFTELSSPSSLLLLESNPQPRRRENVSLVSNEYLFQKAYELFQKCCSYYEHHVPLFLPKTGTEDQHNTGTGTGTGIDAKYIGSLYIGGLGPCAYLAWKLATSPHLSLLSQECHGSSLLISSSTCLNSDTKNLRHHLLHRALHVVNDSLQYHRWDYPRITLLEGPVVGALVMKCLILQSLNHSASSSYDSSSTELKLRIVDIEKSTQDLLNIASVVRTMDRTECEVFYGRAGYLQALSFLIQQGFFFTQTDDHGPANAQAVDEHHPVVEKVCLSIIDNILQEIITNGRQLALEERFIISSQKKSTNSTKTEDDEDSDDMEENILPLLWKWHESFYLGSAHGIVGILHTLLCFYPWIQHHLVLDSPNYSLVSKWIRETIDGLDDFCFPSMNLNSSIDPNWNSYASQQETIHHLLSPKHDRLVHWCHGATGHVLLLIKAYEVLQEEKYLFKAQDIARRVIVPRGLLKKGVGLCHGISGNAYTLLTVYRATASWSRMKNAESSHEVASEWLDMAKNFVVFALEHLDELAEIPDRPYSLFEGMAGLSSLLIDFCNPEHAEFPFYGM